MKPNTRANLTRHLNSAKLNESITALEGQLREQRHRAGVLKERIEELVVLNPEWVNDTEVYVTVGDYLAAARDVCIDIKRIKHDLARALSRARQDQEEIRDARIAAATTCRATLGVLAALKELNNV